MSSTSYVPRSQGVQKRLKDYLRAAGSRSCNPLATEVIPIAERIETRKQHPAYLEATG